MYVLCSQLLHLIGPLEIRPLKQIEPVQSAGAEITGRRPLRPLQSSQDVETDAIPILRISHG